MSVERQQGREYQGDLFDEALLGLCAPVSPATAEPKLGHARSSKRLRRWRSNEP